MVPTPLPRFGPHPRYPDPYENGWNRGPVPADNSFPAMIQAAHVSKWYGPVRALHEVSFEVPRGQIVGLLGPNGAGKTTTIRITTGFFPPTSGSVSVCGHDTVAQSLEARSCIGYLPDAVPPYTE